MLKTTNIINDLDDIPIEWVYEYYLKLNQKLVGQNILIKSPLNPSDKNPSFGIYKDKKNKYRFKDFSTGSQGDHIELVFILFKLSNRAEAAHRVIRDYTLWKASNSGDYNSREQIVITNYRVTQFDKRKWNKLDETFWTSYAINSKILDFYNVCPIESYKMERQVGDDTQQIEVAKRDNMYAYLRSDGTLYKIYQPYIKDMKFIKVRDYIQGTDQLTMQKKYLVICSSLKDMMSFTALGYKDAEVVAPHSENTIIPPHVITAYKLKYKAIAVLFDNDDAGRNAMRIYKDKYDIAGVNLLLEKDLSDSVKAHGIPAVLKELTPNLKLALKRNE